jgi:hypothetical protein
MLMKRQVHLLRTFQNLVREYHSLLRQDRCGRSEGTEWADLIKRFLAARRQAGREEARRAAKRRAAWGKLVRGYNDSRDEWVAGQEEKADDFNFLGVIGATHDEMCHSAMLAWMLDRRIERYGTHAQMEQGFQLFLEEVGLPTAYAKRPYWVRREVVGEESRVDLEVAAPGRFIIHIENKLLAPEGDDQTPREWKDLLRRARALRIAKPRLSADIHALFLTPDGRRPQDEHFRAVTWVQVARVVEKFAAIAKAPNVQLFAAHYAKALRQFVAAEPRTPER